MGIANIIIFLFTLFQSIIIPKLLNVVDFGYWRLFILYITFGGLLHLGFIDGIYVLWARENPKYYYSNILKALTTLVLIMSISTVITALIFFLFGTDVQLLFFVLLFGFINNIFLYFQILHQLQKKYKIVSSMNLFFPLIFIVILIILYFIKSVDYVLVIAGYNLAIIIVTVAYLFMLLGSYKTSTNVATIRLAIWPYISTGFPLLIANLLSLFLINGDMVIISNFFPIDHFAYYAFAVMLLNVVLLLTRALSAVFFPHASLISLEDKKILYSKSSTIIILTGGFLMGLYPLIIMLIRLILPKYLISITYMKVLMLSPIPLMCIQVIHINYFQLFLKQNIYLLIVTALTLVSLVLLIILGKIVKSLVLIAYYKVCILVVWYIVNEISLHDIIAQRIIDIFRRFISIIAIIGLFMGCMMIRNVYYALTIYFISFFALCFILFRGETTKLLNTIFRLQVFN